MVLRGEAGVGKTALLGYLSGQLAGWHVTRAAGVESEMELPYAGLHQLCGPMLDHLDRLPAPQRDALATVFGRSGGAAPDRFLVGLATLTQVAEAADKQLGEPGKNVIADPAPRGAHDRDPLSEQTAGNEPQDLRRGVVEPLRVIDDTGQRPLLGDLGEQRQRGQPHQEPVGRSADTAAEHRRERVALVVPGITFALRRVRRPRETPWAGPVVCGFRGPDRRSTLC